MGLVSISSSVLAYSEFRTPLSLAQFSQGAIHSALQREEGSGWFFDLWGAGYTKGARKTYTEGGTASSTENLAALLFGKSSFTFAEACQGAFISPDQYSDYRNPWIKISTLTPQIDYYEKGVTLGIHWANCVKEGKLHYGLRASVPFRSIEIENDLIDYGEQIEDVYRSWPLDATTTATAGNLGWTARLDFLSALMMYNSQVLVNYKNSAHTNQVTMATQVVSGTTPPVGVIGREDGTLPPTSVNLNVTEAATTGFLLDDGSLGTNSMAKFHTATYDYVSGGLSTDPVAQKKLFVFPFVNAPGVVEGTAIAAVLNSITPSLQESAKDFFDENSITFNTQRKTGIGDLSTNIYLGYEFTKRVYGEGIFGVKIPTAISNTTPLTLYTPTLGNNGHFELQLGTQWQFDLMRCLNLDVNFSYNFVLKHNETRAATFENATVKNLGPSATAKVHWQWLDTRAKFTIFHPDNQCLGLTLAYEFYYKTKDKVAFTETTATDLLGRTGKTLDNDVSALRTKERSHKILFEIFNYFDCFELFLGGGQAFAGKNSPKDSDLHIGVRIEF